MESDVLLNGLLMNPSNAMAETHSRKCVEQVSLPVWLLTMHTLMHSLIWCLEALDVKI